MSFYNDSCDEFCAEDPFEDDRSSTDAPIQVDDPVPDDPRTALRRRLLDFNAACSDPLPASSLHTAPLEYLLEHVLQHCPDGALSDVARACAEDAATPLLDAEDEEEAAGRLDDVRRVVLYGRAFSHVARVQRSVVSCLSEVHQRRQTLHLARSRRDVLDREERDIEEQLDQLAEYAASALIEIKFVDPELAVDLARSGKVRFNNEFVRIDLRDATNEPLGATEAPQGGVRDVSVTDDRVGPLGNSANEEVFKKPLCLQAGVKPFVCECPQANSEMVDPVTPVLPAPVGKNAAKKAKRAAAAAAAARPPGA